MKRPLPGGIGILMVATGAIWVLQGAGIYEGSMMTGQTLWLVIGVVFTLAGIGLLTWAVRSEKRGNGEG